MAGEYTDHLNESHYLYSYGYNLQWSIQHKQPGKQKKQ